LTDTSPPAEEPPAAPPPYPGLANQPPHPQFAQPRADNATLAMVLGIVALGGGALCWLPFCAGPAAWVLGHRSLRAIEANPQLAGHAEALAGMVLGIIATGLGATMLLGLTFLLALGIFAPETFAN
jgi:hypothetical protein